MGGKSGYKEKTKTKLADNQSLPSFGQNELAVNLSESDEFEELGNELGIELGTSRLIADRARSGVESSSGTKLSPNKEPAKTEAAANKELCQESTSAQGG